MGRVIDPRCHIGETHGIYTIIDVLDKKDKYGHWIYKSVCTECGREQFSHYGQISGEKSKTIQCHHVKANGDYIPYGHMWNNKRIARIFGDMNSRCYNANNKSYRWYGAKGIGIYSEWLSNPRLFEEWALNNGYADNLTIDRIDADKDYCPSNCRWIPMRENTRRAGSVSWITVEDTTLTGRQWARELRLGINSINTAIRKYGLDKTKELIVAMLQDPPSTKQRKSNQSWFSVYGIQV